MNTPTDWSAQQLGEYLAALCSAHDERTAIDIAIERAAEAVEAEVAAVIVDGRVAASVGFPTGAVPTEELVAAASATGRTMTLSGLGDCTVLSVPLELEPAGSLIVGRMDDPFSHREMSLLRGMGRALSLIVKMQRVIDAERLLRNESQRQEDQLRQRQILFERMLVIQRSISSRADVRIVFQMVAEAAATLFGDATVTLRIIDPADPLRLELVAACGVRESLVESGRTISISEGISGAAVTERRLVVVDDYRHYHGSKVFDGEGICAAMAAPVSEDGDVVGSLVVGTRTPGRRFDSSEREMLLAFAEHVSLALNDASAVRAIHEAYDTAVHRATHDFLTGLPNRSLVIDRLNRALVRRESHRKPVAVLFVDLDRFKVINDSMGHSIGDEVLIRVAERLQASTRRAETVGRLSGDEFVVICEDIDAEGATEIAHRISAAIAEPLSLYGRDTVLTSSIGISMADRNTRAEDLLRDADVAMYRAKERGRSRVELFDETMRTRMLDRIEIEQSLRRAITTGALELHYQPTYSLGRDPWTGVEALVRWPRSDGKGLTPPDEFIPLAEETGLILPLGKWVLDTACAQLASWRSGYPGLSTLYVSVNLSGKQFVDPDLVDLIGSTLDRAQLPAAALCLEITESVLMDDADATYNTLLELRRLGVQLAIDDFGTGYSSLSYLKRFPVDSVKIDRTFIEGLGVNGDDDAIVAGVIGLAHALRLAVVAEGVENARQLEVLRELGCDVGQGYLLGRPLTAGQVPEAISAYLAQSVG